jgi:hypothetical protein
MSVLTGLEKVITNPVLMELNETLILFSWHSV